MSLQPAACPCGALVLHGVGRAVIVGHHLALCVVQLAECPLCCVISLRSCMQSTTPTCFQHWPTCFLCSVARIQHSPHRHRQPSTHTPHKPCSCTHKRMHSTSSRCCCTAGLHASCSVTHATQPHCAHQHGSNNPQRHLQQDQQQHQADSSHSSSSTSSTAHCCCRHGCDTAAAAAARRQHQTGSLALLARPTKVG